MAWLHSFWGVGTIVSPFAMGYALSTSSWNNGYRIVGFIQLGIALLLLFTLPVWKVNEAPSREEKRNVSIVQAIKIKGVPFLLLGFFAYCALEQTAMQWASTYFVEAKGLTEDKAATFASLIFIGITCGRFVSGFVTDKLGDKKMILIGSSILCVGLAILFLPIESYIATIVAFVIIGFGCGPIYPCIIHSTPYNFGEENSGAIIGIQMASAYIGSTFMPPLFGLIGNSISFKILPIYLFFFLALLVSMILITFKIANNNKSKTPL